MTPRYLVSVTLFITFSLIISGTFGRVGSLFLEKKVGGNISGDSGIGSCLLPT